MKTIFNDNGNTATIDNGLIFPYNGAPEKTPYYRVTAKSDYNNFIYHVSTFETYADAINDVKNCGFNV